MGFLQRRVAFRSAVRACPEQGEEFRDARHQAAPDIPIAAFAYYCNGAEVPAPPTHFYPPPPARTYPPSEQAFVNGVPFADFPQVVGGAGGGEGGPAYPYPLGGSSPCGGVDMIPSAVDLPPVRSRPDEVNNQNPVVIGDTAFVDIITVQVPNRMNGLMKWLGLAAESGAAFGDIQWRVLVGGVPYPGMNNIRTQIGTLTQPAEVNVRATENQFITVQAISLTAGVNHQCRALLRGWHFAPSYMSGDENIYSWRGR